MCLQDKYGKSFDELERECALRHPVLELLVPYFVLHPQRHCHVQCVQQSCQSSGSIVMQPTYLCTPMHCSNRCYTAEIVDSSCSGNASPCMWTMLSAFLLMANARLFSAEASCLQHQYRQPSRLPFHAASAELFLSQPCSV